MDNAVAVNAQSCLEASFACSLSLPTVRTMSHGDNLRILSFLKAILHRIFQIGQLVPLSGTPVINFEFSFYCLVTISGHIVYS